MDKHALIKYIFLASVLLFLPALPIASLSCGESAPEPPSLPPVPTTPEAPSPGTPPPPPSARWTPDGQIGSGEYLSEMSYAGGDYELFWNSDQQYVYIGMRARTSGWVAMAVQPGSMMKDADMVFGYVEDGEVTVLDLFSTGDFGPHPPDIEQGGTNDIMEYGGTEAEGYTTIEFKRALATGDRYDRDISSGKSQIIWAFGPSDSLSPKHSQRGYGEIILPPG